MRISVLLVICLGFLVFSTGALHMGFETSTRAGRLIPLHIPTQTIDSNETFEIPYWLGAFYATADMSANWTLPLTIGNGGQTYPGEFLFIRNYGPATIILLPTTPETIEGASSYLIPAGTILQVLSGYPNWVIVTPSSVSNVSADSGTFNNIQTQNETVNCKLLVGPTSTQGSSCGLTVGGGTISQVYTCPGGNCNNWNVAINPTTTGSTSNVNAITMTTAGTDPSAIASINTLRALSLSARHEVNIPLTMLNAFYAENQVSFFYASNTVDNLIGVRSNGFRGFGASNGSITTVTDFYSDARSAGLPQLNDYGLDVQIKRSNTGGTAAAVRFVTPTGTGTNYGIWANTNIASCAAGFVGGTSGDACLYRGGSNAWLIQNSAGTGASVWISRYSCVGCTAAPANTAVGAISTTISNPALQAFGAVTANAASGLLAFTVNTAAVTCSTAVVTNTNVVAASQVQLTIQSYTGTKFTNGFPVVARANTLGTSSGSFTIELCNMHATNALSGNLYISFWVLN